MQLKYRGIAYQPSVQAVEVTAPEQIGTYRGLPCYAAQPIVRQSHRGLELTYRGVRYTR
jgi:hypothetical protein